MRKTISQTALLAHEELDSSLQSEGRFDVNLDNAIETTVNELAVPISAPPSDNPVLCIGSSAVQILDEIEPNQENEIDNIYEFISDSLFFL